MNIRSITASDARVYQDILERTSEEDRYCRFLHVVNHFNLRDVARFVEPRPDTVGFIAIDPHSRRGLGVVHAFFLPDDAAELAIVVAQDARRRGVGLALLDRLIAELHRRGCRKLMACAFAHNSGFAHLAKTIGMQPDGSLDETKVWSMALDTSRPGGLSAGMIGVAAQAGGEYIVPA